MANLHILRWHNIETRQNFNLRYTFDSSGKGGKRGKSRFFRYFFFGAKIAFKDTVSGTLEGVTYFGGAVPPKKGDNVVTGSTVRWHDFSNKTFPGLQAFSDGTLR